MWIAERDATMGQGMAAMKQTLDRLRSSPLSRQRHRHPLRGRFVRIVFVVVKEARDLLS